MKKKLCLKINLFGSQNFSNCSDHRVLEILSVLEHKALSQFCY